MQSEQTSQYTQVAADLAAAVRHPRSGELNKSETIHRKILRKDPKQVNALHALGVILHQKGNQTAAAKFIEKAISQSASIPDFHLNLASVFQAQGSYEEAINCCKRALELNPNEVTALNNQANAYIALIEAFSEGFFVQKDFYGSDSDRPIFIIGMPRSGTTLIEQIIASHPDVAGAGELIDVDLLTTALTRIYPESGGYPGCASKLDKNVAAELADSYLGRLLSLSKSAARVIDKMPMNYLHLGLLAVLFPSAHIIHCRREPMDVCLSCYFQYFAPQLSYSFGLEDLGFAYRRYERLMMHWRKVLPVPVFDVQYEELVSNQESVSRKLIDFCGLEWNTSCLAFNESKRLVKTASSWQVRQPIYATSIGRWKRYEKHLTPLKEALGSNDQ